MTAKRWIKLSIFLAIVGISALLIFHALYAEVNLSFATSATLCWNGAEAVLTVEDTETLKDYLSGVWKKEQPSGCGFLTSHWVRFTDSKKEVVFYPGLDECGVMVMNSLSKGPYFGAGDETRYYIRELCKKYGIYQ